MTQPLALVLYENILPGTQLVNKLQDLGYRVHSLSDASQLVECSQQVKPMIVLADLDCTKSDVHSNLERLRQTPATQHLPIIVLVPEDAKKLSKPPPPGVTLTVNHTAILNHLSQFLEQALHVD
jgi:PleD family two-component response regulator